MSQHIQWTVQLFGSDDVNFVTFALFWASAAPLYISTNALCTWWHHIGSSHQTRSHSGSCVTSSIKFFRTYFLMATVWHCWTDASGISLTSAATTGSLLCFLHDCSQRFKHYCFQRTVGLAKLISRTRRRQQCIFSCGAKEQKACLTLWEFSELFVWIS